LTCRRQAGSSPTSLDPYLEYLRQRWEEGEHIATVLHQEIVAKGYQRVKMARPGILGRRDGT
jgi:hypothetical protein